MRSYEAARGLFSFMSVVGWIVIVGGVITAIAGISIGSEVGRNGYGRGPGPEVLLFMLPGVGIGIIGIVTLALSQIGRAGVDTAEYSQQMLQLSRESLEVSRQSLRQSEQMRTSFESLKTVVPKEPLATFADLRTGSPERSPETQPNPAPSVGYASRSAEPAISTTSGAPGLYAPSPDFGSTSLNGSTEKARGPADS
jgi:hypothetical protein